MIFPMYHGNGNSPTAQLCSDIFSELREEKISMDTEDTWQLKYAAEGSGQSRAAGRQACI